MVMAMSRAMHSPARWYLLGAVLSNLCWSVKSAVSKEAIAHLQCQACEIGVEEARTYAKDNAIIEEDGLTDMVENLCTTKKKEGRWVAAYDITREDSDSQLIMEKQPGRGECNKECLTVLRACSAAFKGQEETLVGLLLKKSSAKELKKKICKKTCAKKVPKLGKWTDEVFVPRDEKLGETEDMIEKMKAETGMGMKMYKREDLQSMSEGDMETMAAREAYASERQASRMADSEL